MEKNTYSWLNEQKSQLTEIANRQIKVNNSINFEKEYAEKLLNVIDRLNHDDFKVMVMGTFSSGKSTFINALLGQRILPAKMLPSTAIICEIKYAEKTKCTLYPKEFPYSDPISGEVHHTTFEIGVEHLKDYIVINHKKEPKTIEQDLKENPEMSSPFERMVLEWPLGICKEGVEIIDSPGLNDPNSHDIITLEYLPKTDAIIYCMSCAHSFSKLDKDTIEDLRNMGYKSIVFILTNYDQVQDSEEEEEFVATNTYKLGQLTDLGQDGVLFVNSLGGVIGKEKNDAERLKRSNIPIVERKVEEHLVNQKGKAKLERGESEIKNQNRITAGFIENKLKLNSLSVDALQKKYDQQKIILDSAKTKSGLMLKTLELGIVDITSRAGDLGRLFLDSLAPKIEGWVNDFTPVTEISIKPWKIDSTTKTNVEEYVNHVKSKMKLEGTLWGNDVLNPMISTSIKKISADTQDLQKSYESLLDTFNLNMDFDDVENPVGDMEPDALTRFGSLLWGFATGDFVGAGMGYTFGLKGFLSSLVAQIAAAVILLVISMFTPVGWIGVIVAAVTAAIATGAWNMSVIPRRVKKAIIEKMHSALTDRDMKDKMIGDIKAKVKTELGKIVEEAEQMFKNDINPKEIAMNEALTSKKKGELEVKDENDRLGKAKTDTAGIKKDIESFSKTIYV